MKIVIIWLSVLIQAASLQAFAEGFGAFNYNIFKADDRLKLGDSPIDSSITDTFLLSGFPENNGSVNCNNEEPLGHGLRLDKTVSVMTNAARFLACDEEQKIDSDQRFSKSNCALISECSEMKMNNKKAGILSFFTIPKYIAEDYIGLRLETNIIKMQKIETVRKFAEQKFGKAVANSCKTRLDQSMVSTKCEASHMDSGFERMLQYCNPMMSYCFNSRNMPENQKDYKTFMSTYKPASEKESSFMAYLNSKTNTAANDSLGNENELLSNLTELIGSKENSSAKIQSVFTLLNDYEAKGKLDPILSFVNNGVSVNPVNIKKSPHYAFFQQLVTANSNSAAIRKALDKYRLDQTREILGQECEVTPTFNSICEEATNLANSKKVFFMSPESTAKHLKDSEDKDKQRFELLRDLFPDNILNFKDYTVVMDAQRCKAFRFGNDFGSESESYNQFLDIGGTSDYFALPSSSLMPAKNGLGSGLYGNSWQNTRNLYGASTMEERLKAEDVKKVAPDETGLAASKLLVPKAATDAAIGDTKALSKTGDVASEGKIEKVGEGSGTLSGTMAEGLKSSLTTSGASSFNNFYNGNSALKDSYAEKVDHSLNANSKFDISDRKSAGLQGNAMSDKISELTRRLNASEENLEKIKAEKEAAETEKEHQRKIEEENKTIAELKSQINTFKESKIESSAIVEKSTKVESETDKGPATSLGGVKPAQTEVETQSAESNRPAAAAAAVARSQGTASGFNGSSAGVANEASSGAISRLGASGSASNSVDSKSNLVLTKMDGLTSEKASEKIFEKIYELEGVPFFIEVGGVVKEIVPKLVNDRVVKDELGNPIYATIVVGKAGTAAVQQKKSKALAKRAPASISTPADLRADQEEKLKYEHVQYLKLKQLTNGILNKK